MTPLGPPGKALRRDHTTSKPENGQDSEWKPRGQVSHMAFPKAEANRIHRILISTCFPSLRIEIKDGYKLKDRDCSTSPCIWVRP